MPKTVVIKVGGAAISDPARLSRLAAVLSSVEGACRAVVVHGGGVDLDARLARAGHAITKHDGLRATPDDQIDEVVATLAGLVNVRLCGALRAAGARAVGLIASDGGTLSVVPHANRALGRVGEPREGDRGFLASVLASGCLPVVSSVCTDASGDAWNVNADDAAAAIAATLNADEMVFVSDVPGVLGPDGGAVGELTEDAASAWRKDGVISGGMAAKVDAAFRAAERARVMVRLTDVDGLGTWSEGAEVGTVVRQSAVTQ